MLRAVASRGVDSGGAGVGGAVVYTVHVEGAVAAAVVAHACHDGRGAPATLFFDRRLKLMSAVIRGT